MRFMLLMMPQDQDCQQAASNARPSVDKVAAMMQFTAEMKLSGILLGVEGLHPPAKATRVTFGRDKNFITDGPFIETKEVLGGYWMIQVDSKTEAIEWAVRCPATVNDIIEIRQLQELNEFPAELQAVMTKFPDLQAHL